MTSAQDCIQNANMVNGVCECNNGFTAYYDATSVLFLCESAQPSPSYEPTEMPTYGLTQVPTEPPTREPTEMPSDYVVIYSPTVLPTPRPSRIPTRLPTRKPSALPTYSPTRKPIPRPTARPTRVPTVKPTTAYPTNVPTTAYPTYEPTSAQPTYEPSEIPTREPTSAQPTYIPTHAPTNMPSELPTYIPTHEPTNMPSELPTYIPTALEVYPLVDIRMPRIISGCSPLTIDWSGSKGNDGQSWYSITFDVILSSASDVVNVNVNDLVYYLNSNVRSPIVVANSYLSRNMTYIITLTLCNHRQGCGTLSQSVSISATDDAIPTVSILGSQTRTMTRNQDLLLTSSAYITQCDCTRSTSNIQYSWSLFDSTHNFVSEARDPSKLKISANTLDVGKTYTARITATIRDKTAYSTVIVNVIPADINVVISGTPNRQLKLAQRFVLDASQSYDMDIPMLLGQTNPALQFNVHCIQLYSASVNVVQGCDAINIVETSRRDRWEIVSNSAALYFGSVSRVIITVNDTSRIATSIVDVTIIQPSAPLITMITREQQLTSLDVTKQIVISGIVDTETSCVSSWSSTIFDNIDSMSLVPVAVQIGAGTVRTTNLVLKPNMLDIARSYTFALECGTTATYIRLTTNGPPQQGLYEVLPSTGIELSTRFLMTASGWLDSDLPLTYQFGFVSPDGFMTVQGKSEQSYSMAMLPSGEPVTVRVHVYDVYGAYSVAGSDITVQKLSASELMSNINSMMETTASVDDTKQMLSTVSSIINVVDCSLTTASFCAVLNRQSCLKTENICGECITGYYGDMGDSNEICMPLHSRWLQMVIPKTCASANCSGHGLCIYENINTGIVQYECNLGDATCEASCACESGYNGAVCSVSDDILESRQAIRETLISKLQDLTVTEDITLDVLDTWATNIGSISRNPLELSNDALIKVHAVADIILSNADSLTESMSDSLLNALDVTVTEQSRRGRILSDASDSMPMMELLSKYGALMANELYSGQPGASVVRNNFKLVAGAFDSEDSGVLRLPQTSLESYEGIVPVELHINTQQQNAQTIKVSLISTPARLYSADIDVNPVRVQISSDVPTAEMPFTVVLQNNIDMDYASMGSKSIEKYTSECEDGVQANSTYVCENGYIIEHVCPGEYMTLTSECPLTVGQPKCSDNCKMIAYTQTNTTCECTLIFRRRMEAGHEIMDNTGITDVMSMTEYVAGEFIGTLSTASVITPVSVKRVLIVIFMFVVLWTVGLVLIIMYVMRTNYAMRWKMEDMQINLERRKRTASVSKSPYAIQSYLTEYVNTVFPSVYNQTPFVSRIWGELVKHHRYIHMFVGSSIRTTKGVVSGIQLLTTQTMLMFLLAVFYDLQGPSDDGSCARYNVVDQCLQRRSFLNSRETYCKWDYNTGLCSYNPPAFGWKTIAIIGIVVSMMTSVINYSLDYCFGIINAPTFPSKIQLLNLKTNSASVTKELPDKLQNAYALAASSLSVIHSIAKHIQENRLSRQVEMKLSITRAGDYFSNIRDHDSSSECSYNEYEDDSEDEGSESDGSYVEVTKNRVDNKRPSVSGDQLGELLNDINCQRRLLSEEELLEYDKQWGLDPTGEFICQGTSIWNISNVGRILRRRINSTPAAEVLLRELKHVQFQTDMITKDMRTKTDSQRGYELLRIFILDILGRDTVAARIFDTKSAEDIKNTRYVTFGMKGLAWSGVIFTNAFFVYFTILKGYIKGVGWQQSFLAGCITQLLLEVLLFETFECIWVNYIIPSLVWKEVNAAYKLIQTTIDELCNINAPATDYVLNAPDYLFVSTNVAKQYPQLIESIIINTYQTHLPGELYKKWKQSASTLYVSPRNARFGVMSVIMATLQTIWASPFALQRMIIRVSQPVILAGTIVFFTYVSSSAIVSSILAVMGFCGLMYILRRHYASSRKLVHSLDKIEVESEPLANNKKLELNSMSLARIMPAE